MDLNLVTRPDDPLEAGGREVFDPVNAWPDASSRVYVATHRSSPLGIYQYGYDPDTRQAWMRGLSEPGGDWTPWATFGVPLPALVIDSLNPASMVIGDPEQTLEVIGEGFTRSAVIIFNGGEERTTFVDSTKLTTQVKPALASFPITLPVYVRQNMRVSNTVNFSFTAAQEELTGDERQVPSRK